ncbi:hypothetical protein [Pedobacter sp.]|uniref:hypothetical protein n=1 Tax=Pedobacter sp. TaxID=1411316 RepID=UPI0031E28433
MISENDREQIKKIAIAKSTDSVCLTDDRVVTIRNVDYKGKTYNVDIDKVSDNPNTWMVTSVTEV